MPNSQDLVRLRHMLDAARKAVDFTHECNRESFGQDEKLVLSVLRLLEVLGEATKNISAELRQKHPEVPWRQISRTRDRLIHGYFDVDLDVVWGIVSEDLPPLVTALEQIIPQGPS